MERVPNEEKIRERKLSSFKEMHKRAIKNKARKEFILTVSHMIPDDEYSIEGLDSIGFKSLRHFIRDCAGLHLTAKEFMNLAFAFDRYVRKAYEVVNHLIQVDGWTDLIDLIPDGHADMCGPELKANGTNQHKKKPGFDIIKPNEKGGTSKSYTLRRLARDSETSPKVAELYKKVKRKEISANKAALELGWRTKTTTIKKDVTSAAKTIKKFFSDDELAELKSLL